MSRVTGHYYDSAKRSSEEQGRQGEEEWDGEKEKEQRRARGAGE